VECCLQERSWNPYYSHLLQRLLASSKAHRVTLQYCLWDQFKLVEQTDMRRLINLAHLTAQLIASFTLSATILKVGHALAAAVLLCMISYAELHQISPTVAAAPAATPVAATLHLG